MALDFTKPEYELFTDLTSLDKLQTKNKIAKGIANAQDFQDVLEVYKNIDFLDEYFKLLGNRSYKDMKTISDYNNYVFNYPIRSMLGEFVFNGFLNRDLTYKEKYFMPYGEKIFDSREVRNMKRCEGIIMEDGNFLSVGEQKTTHELCGLWLYLHGYDLGKVVRYSSGLCDDPIFFSMYDYYDMDKSEMEITNPQAIAIYNIFQKCQKFNDFKTVIGQSRDITTRNEEDGKIRKRNAITLEDALGKGIVSANELLRDWRGNSYVKLDGIAFQEPNQ